MNSDEQLRRALSLLSEAQGLIESCASFYNAQDQADAAQWILAYEAFIRERGAETP